MELKGGESQAQVALWFPFEFFVQSGLANGDTSRAVVDRQLRFLKPYQTIVVQCTYTQDDGSSVYASRPEVCARAVLRLDNGEEIAPLDLE